jgi:hypothetical protein
MFTTQRPAIEKPSRNSDTVEYYNFFIDSSAGMGAHLLQTVKTFNNIIDGLIERSQSREIYGSLETFHSQTNVISKISDLKHEGENLKLRPFENFSPNSFSSQKRHLYNAVRLQTSMLCSSQRYFRKEDLSKIRIKGFLITAGLDEQKDNLQLWAAQKQIQTLPQKNIEYKIIVNQVFQSTIQQDLQCLDSIFYTGK